MQSKRLSRRLSDLGLSCCAGGRAPRFLELFRQIATAILLKRWKKWPRPPTLLATIAQFRQPPGTHFLKGLSLSLLILIGGACASFPVKSHEEIEMPERIEDPNSYQFSVGIHSPDKGCEQYADWWEVLSETGTLIYRRILIHSHVHEQPFIRSGGAVRIAADEVVYVRAHMHPAGYGGSVFKGSVQTGFQKVTVVGPGFAAEVEREPPQPDDCAF